MFLYGWVFIRLPTSRCSLQCGLLHCAKGSWGTWHRAVHKQARQVKVRLGMPRTFFSIAGQQRTDPAWKMKCPGRSVPWLWFRIYASRSAGNETGRQQSKM